MANDEVDDATLLASVTHDQLLALCQQCNIEDLEETADKPTLLRRLRQHADEQAQAAKERLEQRRATIQEGGDNEKERYERSDEETSFGYNSSVEEEDEPFFFFEDPHLVVPESARGKEPVEPLNMPLTSAEITSPPPPTEPNANGERVVKMYSTSDQNDLTGIAASQPTNGPFGGDLSGTMGATTPTQPWEATASTQTSQRQKDTDAAMAAAREQVTEVVAGLLVSTNAPGFVQDDDVASLLPMPRTTFDPSTVPSALLDSCAASLRMGRGQVLRDVLYEFEMRAIGFDGLAGDDLNRGGGHYQAVQHVRAFLDGYRKAQVRAFSRETATLLLDKLVQEGVNGLDMTLATMGRSNDDVGSGELNESLMEFLNDVIRQQEKKVDRLVSERMDAMESSVDASFSRSSTNIDDTVLEEQEEADPMDQLWNVTTTDEGNRIETLDPNDPKVKQILEDELEKVNTGVVQEKIPSTAPEQLLLLLTLLRERIKVEATFVMDEKSRNLRLLAYCLRLGDDQEREQLIFNQLGKSLDGLDSFIELVSSSIEYGESTSYELQPAKKRVLNVPQIKHILRIAKEVKKKQTVQASGLQP